MGERKKPPLRLRGKGARPRPGPGTAASVRTKKAPPGGVAEMEAPKSVRTIVPPRLPPKPPTVHRPVVSSEIARYAALSPKTPQGRPGLDPGAVYVSPPQAPEGEPGLPDSWKYPPPTEPVAGYCGAGKFPFVQPAPQGPRGVGWPAHAPPPAGESGWIPGTVYSPPAPPLGGSIGWNQYQFYRPGGSISDGSDPFAKVYLPEQQPNTSGRGWEQYEFEPVDDSDPEPDPIALPAAPMQIDPSRVVVWVHTWHGRDRERNMTLRSLEESDVENGFEVMRQPPGVDRDVFYVETLADLADREDVEWMLRVEDDAVVNRHLLYNACTWEAVNDPLFGAGWLSVTNDMLADQAHCGLVRGHRTREYHEAHFAGGVLMRTSILRELLPSIEQRLGEGDPDRPGKRFAPGCALSNAVWRAGLRVFYHLPSIVAIDLNLPTYHGGSQCFWLQPFDANWRR